MNSIVDQRVLEVCDACGRFIEYWGFKAIHGRVWAYLALTREPISQRTVADALQVSRSLVSMAISDLCSYGLVSSVGEHRNAPYRANLDVWPVIAEVLRRREWMLLEEARISLEGLLAVLEHPAPEPPSSAPEAALEQGGAPDPEGAAAARFHLPRLRRLLRMTELAQQALRLLIAARLPPLYEEGEEGQRRWLQRARRWTSQLRGALRGERTL